METHMFTVFDSAAKAYLEPFSAPSTEFAIREFRAAVNKEGHQFNKFAADYTLFYIGIFDVSTGVITAQHPVSLGVGVTFLDGPSFPEIVEA